MGNKSKSSKPGLLGKSYLFGYNAAQVFGWSYLLYQLVNHFLQGGNTETLWEVVRWTVVVFQNAALIEVLNVAAGLVKSSVVITLVQVMSRVMVVCGLLLATPTAPLSPGLPLALLAWSISEIVRYLYYALNIVGAAPYLLIWCRYTFFIALYPIGVTGELLCFYAAQSYVSRAKLWTWELPNAVNFTFSYHILLLAIMASYVPLFPQMYLHMFSQRKKIIGGNVESKKSS